MIVLVGLGVFFNLKGLPKEGSCILQGYLISYKKGLGFAFCGRRWVKCGQKGLSLGRYDR